MAGFVDVKELGYQFLEAEVGKAVLPVHLLGVHCGEILFQFSHPI